MWPTTLVVFVVQNLIDRLSYFSPLVGYSFEVPFSSHLLTEVFFIDIITTSIGENILQFRAWWPGL